MVVTHSTDISGHTLTDTHEMPQDHMDVLHFLDCSVPLLDILSAMFAFSEIMTCPIGRLVGHSPPVDVIPQSNSPL
jgi:hypothetical protein